MQYDLNLRDYIRIFQKRKWILILMPVLAGLLGYFLTPVPPTLYEASGQLKISRRTMPADAMMDAFYFMEGGSRLDTHAQVMLSREVLKDVATELGVLTPQTDVEGTLTTIPDSELAERQDWQGFIASLEGSMTVDIVPGTSILEVTCTRPREDQAVEWLNTLLDTYAARNAYEVNEAVIESKEFLEEQLEMTRASLRDAEEELTDFLLENAEAVSLGPGEAGLTQEALEQTEQELASLEVQLELIERAIETDTVANLEILGRLVGEDQDPNALRLRSELSTLQQERQSLLLYQNPGSPEVRDLDRRIDANLQALQAALEAQRDQLLTERDRLQAKLGVLPVNDVVRARLERDVQVNTELYNQLTTEYLQAQIRDAERFQEVTVIERAVGATRVTESGRISKGLVAALVGLLLGVIVALLVETLDTSIGAIEDVESLLNLPVIGIIPPIDFDEIREAIRREAPEVLEHPDINHLVNLVSHYDPRSPVAEAYRALRTNVDKARAGVDGKVMIVTSSVLEEGKTTTSANLALTFAQMGRKTLLVAADLRRPDLHRIYGIRKEPGLADVLTGSMPWDAATRGLSDILLGELSMDVVMLTPGMDNLHILPSGSNPLNPAELLSSDATRDLIERLRDEFDIIIIDTPPVIPVTDSAILAEHADGVVLVYEVGKVGRDVLKRAKSHLDNVHADVWGIVMNDVKAEAETTLRDTDYYYYHYRYEDSEPAKGSRLRLGERAARLFRDSGS